MELSNSWKEVNRNLEKTFEFKNFLEVIDFVNKVAKIAEEVKHHPDLLIFDYKKLKVSTCTHEIGEITQKDYELASKIDLLES